MRKLLVAVLVGWSLLALGQGGDAQTQPGGTKIPGLEVAGFWAGVCPRYPPLEIDLNGDGHPDLLFPVCQRGRFKEYLPPEVGAQMGLIGALMSMKADTGNKNFTMACALDGVTGKLLWEFQCGGLINEYALSKDGSHLFLASHDNHLYSIDTSSGKVAWGHDFGGNIMGMSSDADRMVAVTARNRVTAIGLKEGNVLWDIPVKVAVMSAGWGYFLSDGLSVFVSSLDNRVLCLDQATGTTRWSYTTQGNPSLRALVGKTLLIAEGQGLLAAVDTETGKSRWTYDTKGYPYLEPLSVSANLVSSFNGRNGSKARIFCVDLSSGTEKWAKPLEKIPSDSDRTIILPEDETLYRANLATKLGPDGVPVTLFMADRKNLHALDPASGAVQWSAPVNDTQLVFLGGELVLVQDRKKGVLCLEAVSGKSLWTAKVDKHIRQVVEDGGLFLCLQYNGTLLALESATGRQTVTVPLGEPNWIQPWRDGKILLSDHCGTSIIQPVPKQ